MVRQWALHVTKSERESSITMKRYSQEYAMSHSGVSRGSSVNARISWQALVAIVVLNLIIRSAWLMYMHPPQISDFAWYLKEATTIYQGHGYTVNGVPTAYWPAGYVYFLSLLFRLTGVSVIAGLIANAALSVGIVIVVYLSTLKVSQSQVAAVVAGVGYTVLPSQIAWNSVLGTEELFTFLLFLSLYIYLLADFLHPYRRVVLSGLVMGLACIVRPTVELFPIFLFAYEWLIKRLSVKQALLKVAVFTVVMFITVSPLTIRNYVAMHHLIFVSTNGGVNLWQGIHTNSGYYWSNNPAINPMLKAGSNEVLRNQIGEKAFEQFVLHHPKTFAINGFKKIYALYKNDQNVFYFFHAVHMPHWSGRLYLLAQQASTWFYRLWMVVAVAGIIFLARIRPYYWRRAALFFTFVFYNTAVFFVFPAWDRFRYPMMPLWAIGFGIAALWVWKSQSNHTTDLARGDVGIDGDREVH